MRTRIVAGILTLACVLSGQESRALRPIAVGKRVALVVGNANYTRGALKNPVNDAHDLGVALGGLGFAVTEKSDLTLRGFETALNEFTKKVSEGDLALVYFAGHGLQIENENYLLPVDFVAESEADVPYVAFPASRLRARLEATGARVRVLVFDACRNNPYQFKRGVPGGLAAMTGPAEGTLIAFAAGDNQTADENRGERNGLYTKYLLEALRACGGLKDVFERARAEVFVASGKKQFPALYDMVVGRLVLGESAREVARVSPVMPRVDEEEVYFGECKEKKGEFCKVYLEQYPSGRYAKLARLYVVPVERVAERVPERIPERVEAVGLAAGTRKVAGGTAYRWIPAGSFLMGCSPGDGECLDNEKPAKRVEIRKGFWMGETEVTQGAYERVMGRNPSKSKSTDRPVEQVNWNEAREYCGKVGGRLPREEEWEYAARAGTTGARYGDLDSIAWHTGNSGGQTHPVGQKEANAWGLVDMIGNLMEWTETSYDPTTKVLRGGSFNFYVGFMRASYRGGIDPSKRYLDTGFRCLRDSLDPKKIYF